MECSICKLSIEELNTGCVVSSCGHKHHFLCISTWYEVRKSQNLPPNCPLCRIVPLNLESPSLERERLTINDNPENRMHQPFLVIIINLNKRIMNFFLLFGICSLLYTLF